MGRAWRYLTAVPEQLQLNNHFFGLWFDVFLSTWKIDNCEFEIPRILTSRGFRGRFVCNSYEPNERKDVRQFLRPEDRVLELGACLGVVSCITNKLLAEPKNHVVVEANPLLIPVLEMNRTRNDCAFHIVHCLVTRQMDGTFYLHDLVVGGSASRATGKAVVVPVKAVEEVGDLVPGGFNALIMDIEGGELAFLRENPGFLSQTRLAIIEFHAFAIGQKGVEECQRLLVRAGLNLVKTEINNQVWLRAATPAK